MGWLFVAVFVLEHGLKEGPEEPGKECSCAQDDTQGDVFFFDGEVAYQGKEAGDDDAGDDFGGHLGVVDVFLLLLLELEFALEFLVLEFGGVFVEAFFEVVAVFLLLGDHGDGFFAEVGGHGGDGLHVLHGGAEGRRGGEGEV